MILGKVCSGWSVVSHIFVAWSWCEDYCNIYIILRVARWCIAQHIITLGSLESLISLGSCYSGVSMWNSNFLPLSKKNKEKKTYQQAPLKGGLCPVIVCHPVQDVFLPHAQCSWVGLYIHCSVTNCEKKKKELIT